MLVLVESLQTKNVELERQLSDRSESTVLARPTSPPPARKRKAAAARVSSSEGSSSEDDWAGPAAPSPSRRPPRRKSRDAAAEPAAPPPPPPPPPRVRAPAATKPKQARKRAALKLVSSDDDDDGDGNAAAAVAAADGESPRQAIIKMARTGSFASEFEPRPATPPEPTQLPTLAALPDLPPASAKSVSDPTLAALRALAWGTWWTAAPMRDLPPPLVGRSAGPAPGAQDYVAAVVRPAAGTHAQAAWERLATLACLTPTELALVRGIAGGMLRPAAPLGTEKVREGTSARLSSRRPRGG